MFEGKSVWEIFRIGGFTMYILLFCSVLSIGVIMERLIYYRKKARVKRTDFMAKIRKEIKGSDWSKAVELAE